MLAKLFFDQFQPELPYQISPLKIVESETVLYESFKKCKISFLCYNEGEKFILRNVSSSPSSLF